MNAQLPACRCHARFHLSQLLALTFACFTLPAFTRSFSIDWSTTDGGGGTSTGGVYSVSGTIGQPDASGAMTGGQYFLAGGFWSLYTGQNSGTPVLGIKLTTTNTVQVYWPSPSAGFNLQVNTNLVSTNWSPSAETVQDNGSIRFIIVNPPTGHRFYRLNNP